VVILTTENGETVKPVKQNQDEIQNCKWILDYTFDICIVQYDGKNDRNDFPNGKYYLNGNKMKITTQLQKVGTTKGIT
jgi:hypothetical protein